MGKRRNTVRSVDCQPMSAGRGEQEPARFSKPKVAATLVIHDASLMSPNGAKRVMNFLLRQIKYLKTAKGRDLLAPRFTARYRYEGKNFPAY